MGDSYSGGAVNAVIIAYNNIQESSGLRQAGLEVQLKSWQARGGSVSLVGGHDTADVISGKCAPQNMAKAAVHLRGPYTLSTTFLSVHVKAISVQTSSSR
jgi:hypothetical protein